MAEEIIDLAQARSAHACTLCGGRGRPMERGGWIAALCPAHAKATRRFRAITPC